MELLVKFPDELLEAFPENLLEKFPAEFLDFQEEIPVELVEKCQVTISEEFSGRTLKRILGGTV